METFCAGMGIPLLFSWLDQCSAAVSPVAVETVRYRHCTDNDKMAPPANLHQ